MNYRNQVLDLLSSVTQDLNYQNNANLKKSLMQLGGGEPWRYMLKEFFPSLRKAVYRIDYQVKCFNLEEAKEIVKSKPQNLSLNEMFIVANTYDKGSKEFTDLFETAVRLFPSDQTANINAAIAAIERQDYISAEHYLQKVRTKIRIPEYDNAMGVYNMLKTKDYDKAKEYFTSAAEAGLEQANKNLDELTKLLESIDKVKQHERKVSARTRRNN